MMPAQQRFYSLHRTGGDGDRRLVVNFELTTPESFVEVVREAEALCGMPVHDRLENRPLPAPFALGAVHGDVGVAQQLGAGFAFRMGNPDAQAHVDLGAVHGEWLVHDRECPLGRVLGNRGFACVLDDDGELVTAQAGDGVTRAQAARQTSRNLDEHLVSRVVAQAVVHGFEPVQIGQQDGDRMLAPRRARNRVIEALAEEGPVREPGERVGEGAPFQLLFQLAAVRSRPASSTGPRRPPPRPSYRRL